MSEQAAGRIASQADGQRGVRRLCVMTRDGQCAGRADRQRPVIGKVASRRRQVAVVQDRESSIGGDVPQVAEQVDARLINERRPRPVERDVGPVIRKRTNAIQPQGGAADERVGGGDEPCAAHERTFDAAPVRYRLDEPQRTTKSFDCAAVAYRHVNDRSSRAGRLANCPCIDQRSLWADAGVGTHVKDSTWSIEDQERVGEEDVAAEPLDGAMVVDRACGRCHTVTVIDTNVGICRWVNSQYGVTFNDRRAAIGHVASGPGHVFADSQCACAAETATGQYHVGDCRIDIQLDSCKRRSADFQRVGCEESASLNNVPSRGNQQTTFPGHAVSRSQCDCVYGVEESR